MSYSPHPPQVVIVGRSKDTVNYENALGEMGIPYLTTMNLGCLTKYDALLLPGGGDITPAFFGQKDHGSHNIDTELDIIQFQALELFVSRKLPVLGICKGMQIINVYFGGSIIQHIKEADHHAWDNGDKQHPTTAISDSCLERIYGTSFITNSAHHQAIGSLGRDLDIIQVSDDGIPEGIIHRFLPILGVQWHPERLFSTPSPSVQPAPVNGKPLFSYFLSLCSSAGT